MKFLKITFLIFFSFSFNAFTQIPLDEREVKMTHRPEIDDLFTLSHRDGSTLAPDYYKVEYKKGWNTNYFFLTLKEDQTIDSPILAKNENDQLLAKLYLKEQKVVKIESFDGQSERVAKEQYKTNDTIYDIRYSKLGEIKSEKRTVNNEIIYSKNCSYDEEDNLIDCDIKDRISGISESYYHDILVERTQTKNLGENTEAIKTSFTRDGVLDNTLEYYKNGKQKRTKSDGTYEITEFMENGEKVESYDKNGKLIETFFAHYPSTIEPVED